MSVYNAEKYLKEAVESILNQTYKNFEFIIINDCSLDNSWNILKGYEKDHKNIRLINNVENLGLTKNLNKALLLSKGQYIARMDADDISELNRFERQREFLENNEDVAILGTFSKDINEFGEVIRTRTVPITHIDIIRMLPKFSPISHPTVMFRKKKLEKLGYYNTKYRTSQDLDMWLRAAGAGLKFYNIPEYLFKYRMDNDYVGRKTFKFRWNDFKLRLNGYKHIKLPWYKYIYALIPLVLGIIPVTIYNLLKKIDPR
jgi:glycosyltransferase involved in cell wall biosynthesis